MVQEGLDTLGIKTASVLMCIACGNCAIKRGSLYLLAEETSQP
jgi:hypothetical protein